MQHQYMGQFKEIEKKKSSLTERTSIMLKLFRENQTFNLLKREKATQLTKIPNEYFNPQIIPLNNDGIMLVKMAKKKVDIYKLGDTASPTNVYKVGQFYTVDNVTVAHQSDSLIFIGCLQQKIDIITAENFVKFKRFATNSHPSCFYQINADFLLVGQFQGDLAFIDVKNMRIQELGKIGNSVVKIESICKVSQKNTLAIATQSEGIFLAKYEISPHTALLDFELVKKNGHFLTDQHVRYIDEFAPNKLLAITENSGAAVIIDLKQKTQEDFLINKYDKINMFGISKMPRSPNHYIIKHKNGIKLINPLLKKWYELCFEFQFDRECQLTETIIPKS